jgi:hypothetical protein
VGTTPRGWDTAQRHRRAKRVRALERTSSPGQKLSQVRHEEALLRGSRAHQGYRAGKEWPKAAQGVNPRQLRPLRVMEKQPHRFAAQGPQQL